MSKEAIVHPELGAPPDFSRAIVASGRTVYLAGQAPTRADGTTAGSDAEAQSEACFTKLQMLLEHVGGSLDDLVMLTIYLRSMSDLEGVVAAQRRLLSLPYPAMSAFAVSDLVGPDWLLEIDGIAVLAH